jgi:myo-inositol-1(or 4)-monophosphatase
MSLQNMDLTQVVKDARKAALEGRSILLQYFGRLSQVSEKHQAGLVSEADIESERVITEYLRSRYPDIEVLAEEQSYKDSQAEGSSGGGSSEARGRWIIDPLDGTTNYVHGFHIFCISIGLEIDGQIELGVIDVPLLNRTYWTRRGHGAWVDDQKLSVSSRNQLSDSVVATGFFSPDKNQLGEQVEVFGAMLRQVRGVRRPGAAAFDLCMVAQGVFDGFWEQNLKPWDTAAGSLLVEEAGGVVTNYCGDRFHPDMKSIVAANPFIHKQIQTCIDQPLVQTNC